MTLISRLTLLAETIGDNLGGKTITTLELEKDEESDTIHQAIVIDTDGAEGRIRVNGVGKSAPVVVSLTGEGSVKSLSVGTNSAGEAGRKWVFGTGELESIILYPKKSKCHAAAPGDGNELEFVMKPNGTPGRQKQAF